jgi:NitT/TauT family transport system ATP-binding protein
LTKTKVSVQKVSKEFTTKDGLRIQVLRNVSFNVHQQEFVCVVGPNGCGKTTLLRIIAGLEKPTSGRVLIDNEEAKPGKAALIFQEFSLLPWRTVIDNIKFGLEIRGIPRDESLKTAQKYLNLVGLSKFEHAYPHELSEGMKQKVAIARALATNPPVLLMDEPFAFLDAQTRNFMQEELLKIWEKEKKTVIFITHNVDEAVYLADRIIILTARPGQVKATFEMTPNRPRKRTSKTFTETRGKILNLLEEEVVPA